MIPPGPLSAYLSPPRERRSRMHHGLLKHTCTTARPVKATARFHDLRLWYTHKSFCPESQETSKLDCNRDGVDESAAAAGMVFESLVGKRAYMTGITPVIGQHTCQKDCARGLHTWPSAVSGGVVTRTPQSPIVQTPGHCTSRSKTCHMKKQSTHIACLK
jgi:hypothetical protein